MSQVLLFSGFSVFTIASCGYAWFRGGFPEKSAAATLLIGNFVATMILVFQELAHSSGVILALDGLLGLYFVHLAMRYGKMWIVGEVGLMAVQFALQSLFIMKSIPHDTFAVGNNLVTGATLALLAYGTWQANHDEAGKVVRRPVGSPV